MGDKTQPDETQLNDIPKRIGILIDQTPNYILKYIIFHIIDKYTIEKDHNYLDKLDQVLIEIDKIDKNDSTKSFFNFFNKKTNIYETINNIKTISDRHSKSDNTNTNTKLSKRHDLNSIKKNYIKLVDAYSSIFKDFRYIVPNINEIIHEEHTYSKTKTTVLMPNMNYFQKDSVKIYFELFSLLRYTYWEMKKNYNTELTADDSLLNTDLTLKKPSNQRIIELFDDYVKKQNSIKIGDFDKYLKKTTNNVIKIKDILNGYLTEKNLEEKKGKQKENQEQKDEQKEEKQEILISGRNTRDTNIEIKIDVGNFREYLEVYVFYTLNLKASTDYDKFKLFKKNLSDYLKKNFDKKVDYNDILNDIFKKYYECLICFSNNIINVNITLDEKGYNKLERNNDFICKKSNDLIKEIIENKNNDSDQTIPNTGGKSKKKKKKQKSKSSHTRKKSKKSKTRKNRRKK